MEELVSNVLALDEFGCEGERGPFAELNDNFLRFCNRLTSSFIFSTICSSLIKVEFKNLNVKINIKIIISIFITFY